MQGKENQLFRKEALERLSSPERLDQLMKVVDPRAWLPLATMGSLVLVAAVWSVFGRLPLTVTGQGVLIQPRRVVQIQAPGEGQVLTLEIQSGDTVKKGQLIASIRQASIEKQLELERAKLATLSRQKQDTTQLQKQRIDLEKANIIQQREALTRGLERETIEQDLREKSLRVITQNRASLQKTLLNFEGLAPELRSKSLTSLAKNRENLQQQLTQIKELLPTLKERIESRRKLLDRNLITGDALLSAEQEYLNSLSQVSDLETRIKSLDVEETNTQGQYLKNLNDIDQIKNQLQSLDVQETNVQREYLASLNKIDQTKSQLESLDSQEAKLNQEILETSLDKSNRIDEVRQRIAELEQALSDKSKITSQYNGRVLEVAVVSGQLLAPGTRLASIEAEDAKGKLMSVAYFADKDGKKIKEGMSIQVTPSIVKRERYGGILGEVTKVSPFPVTNPDMLSIIGNENMVNALVEGLKGSAPVQVFADLQVDPNTTTGYQWSSSKGPDLKLSSGTTTEVRVKVAEVAPISYVIPLLRSLTGVY